MSTSNLSYQGFELELFSTARRWKSYVSRKLKPFIGSTIAEVGAGIGGTTAFLCEQVTVNRWLCLEPDTNLAEKIETAVTQRQLPGYCQVENTTLHDLEENDCFDTILYIDVLEHIPDDNREVIEAIRRLKLGGKLVVLAPAHQWLYTPFDAAIGHHRRYNTSSLLALTQPNTKLIAKFYLDSAGLMLSLANRIILRSSMPSPSQVFIWDKFFIPLSILLDTLTRYRLGKSVVAVWQKENY